MSALLIADVPAGVVIVMSTAPATFGGLAAVIRESLMTLMLGLSLALGAVSVSFADDAPAPTKKKGKKKKSTDEPAPKSK